MPALLLAETQPWPAEDNAPTARASKEHMLSRESIEQENEIAYEAGPAITFYVGILE